jgi:hypothetical protein
MIYGKVISEAIEEKRKNPLARTEIIADMKEGQITWTIGRNIS